MAAGATYEPIATTTLGSAASTITFSSITSAYTDLRLVLSIPTVSTANYALMKFNSSTVNIGFVTLAGGGTSAYTGTSASDVQYLNYQGTLSNATPTFIAVDILSYAGSTYKSFLVSTNYDKGASSAGYVEAMAGVYTSTSAITRIDVYTSSGNFNTGTTATIYGIKSA